jgi:sulfite oxidase
MGIFPRNLPTRRGLLLAAGAGFLLAQDRSKHEPLLVRSARPEDLEMPLSGFADYLTPNDQFFVRSHSYVPQVDANGWRLKVEGEVAAPLSLTIDDIRKMPGAELAGVLECAGNGRRFYEPAVPGVQWGNGAVGCARWRGVRLGDVLAKAKFKNSAKEILFDGADTTPGTMPDFQRSIPLQKALDANTLLAYEMNGETLPVKHGFPLRVIAAGWAGDSWVKWLTGIRVLDKEFDGFWMKSAYRHPGRAVAPGSAVPPEQMTPVTSLRVKSAIWSPVDGANVAPGSSAAIRGVAWSGDRGPVAGVEVSMDGGRSWRNARIVSPRSRFGWLQWEQVWSPPAGYFTILARARDASGDAQPLAQEWNPSGYLWNVVPHIHVNAGPDATASIEAAPSSAASSPAPSAFRACLVCHQEDLIAQQRLTAAQWDRELSKMTSWGARVPAEGRDELLRYLVSRSGSGR